MIFRYTPSQLEMVLENLVIWYQKKIGSYDRQDWETTVEDRILEGFASITMKNARVKTEFIDVDLVRGKLTYIFNFFFID